LAHLARARVGRGLRLVGGRRGPRDDVDDTAHLAQIFTRRGADLDYLVQHGGQHSEVYWRQRVPGALGFLLGGR